MTPVRIVVRTISIILSLILLALIALIIMSDQPPKSMNTMNDGLLSEDNGYYITTHPDMVKNRFRKNKDANEFRVLLLGGSQLMGTPYVHQHNDRVVSFFGWAVLPNRGGVGTWLEEYFKILFPEKEITLINAAIGNGGTLSDAAGFLFQEYEKISPDMIIILSGNNERQSPMIEKFKLKDIGFFRSVVQELADEYEHSLGRITDFIDKKGAVGYILTVPTNIRDWLPYDKQTFSVKEAERLFSQGKVNEMYDYITKGNEWGDNSLNLFFAARYYDYTGEKSSARDLYIEAKDKDKSFYRCRSILNNAIREKTGKNLNVIDMEKILYNYSEIPGYDLFHDYCHFKMKTNRLVALEIMKQYIVDNKLPQSSISVLEEKKITILTPEHIRTLYFLKTIKWLRYKYYLAAKEIRNLNTRNVIKNYENAEFDYSTVAGQLERYKKMGTSE